MSESTLPAAGWYPASHANGEMRYWDGSAWVEPVVPRVSFMKRTVTRRTGAIVAGSTLVAGMLLGAGLGSSGSASQMASLASQVSSLETEVTEAAETVTEAGSEVEEAVAQLAAARAEVTRVQEQLDASTATVNEMQTAATAAQAELDSRAAQIADLQGKVSAQQSAPAPAQPAAPTNTYFENCTAARAAGAAPVRRGDPGYGKHLDRDGDGVGCE